MKTSTDPFSARSTELLAEYDHDLVSRRRLSVDDYYAMADAGIIKSDERLELIDGEIIAKVSPQRASHASSVERVTSALITVFSPDYRMRIQAPLHLSDYDEPEPDVLIYNGKFGVLDDRHPGAEDVALLVEIADSSLRQDLIRKSALYARFGIPEYWVVNLVKRELVVFQEPDRTLGDGQERKYLRQTVFALDSSIPVGSGSISVSSLFPAVK